jgi:hypothetical protein
MFERLLCWLYSNADNKLGMAKNLIGSRDTKFIQ